MHNEYSVEQRNHPADYDAAFHAIYDRHYQGLFAFFLSKTGHRETAAELLQELFLKIWKQIGDLNSMAETRQRYWIYRVAQNLVVDYYRKNSLRAEAALESVPERMISDMGRNGPEEIAETKESYGLLEAAINSMPAELRTIFCMSTIGNMNSSEIGAALGLSSGTVRYKLVKARKWIAAVMEPNSGAGGAAR
jgi:RNA polymerase sigma factor (sigma-70 family)